MLTATPGWRSAKRCSAPGSTATPAVSLVAIVSVPCSPVSSVSSSFCISSSTARIRAAWPATTLPASVRPLPRPLRRSSIRPVAASSVRRCIDADGWPTAQASAAAAIEPRRCTSSSSRSRSGLTLSTRTSRTVVILAHGDARD